MGTAHSGESKGGDSENTYGGRWKAPQRLSAKKKSHGLVNVLALVSQAVHIASFIRVSPLLLGTRPITCILLMTVSTFGGTTKGKRNGLPTSTGKQGKSGRRLAVCAVDIGCALCNVRACCDPSFSFFGRFSRPSSLYSASPSSPISYSFPRHHSQPPIYLWCACCV